MHQFNRLRVVASAVLLAVAAACEPSVPAGPASPGGDVSPASTPTKLPTPTPRSRITSAVKGEAIVQNPALFQSLGNTSPTTAWFYFQSPANSVWYIVDLGGHIYSLDAVGSQYSGGIGWRPINQVTSSGYPSAGTNFANVTVSSDGRSVSIGSATNGGLPAQAAVLQNTTQAISWLYFQDARGWWYISEATAAAQVLLLADADPSIAGGLGWQPVYNATYSGYPSAGQTFSSVSLGSGRLSTVFGAATAAVGSLTVTIAGLPAGASGSVSVTGPNQFAGTVFHTTTFSGLVPSSYLVAAQSVVANGTTYTPTPASQSVNVSASNTSSVTVTYSTSSSLLAAPTLISPSNGAGGVSTSATFNWSAVGGADRYWLMVATSVSAFPTDPSVGSCPACIASGSTNTTSFTLPAAFPNSSGGGNHPTLNPGTVYYWKVQAWNSNGTEGVYSAALTFTTVAQGNTSFRFSAFPLQNRTSSTAVINSIFDHSMAYGSVIAYTGEAGHQQYGASESASIAGRTVYGFKGSMGTPFIVNGHYAGAGEPLYLYYEHHAGYDYRTTDQSADGKIPVFAAAPGTVTWVDGDANCLGSAYCTIIITHTNGYTSHYLHLSHRDVPNGASVVAGQRIGVSGSTGAAAPHLHFEVQLNGVAVDPYGWSGPGADPYTAATNRVLW